MDSGEDRVVPIEDVSIGTSLALAWILLYRRVRPRARTRARGCIKRPTQVATGPPFGRPLPRYVTGLPYVENTPYCFTPPAFGYPRHGPGVTEAMRSGISQPLVSFRCPTFRV